MAGLRKILLVEDSFELRQIYELFLRQHGYETATAIDGEDGLRVAKEFQPDLIFLDVMMPKMDGFQVLHTLRHDPTYGCTKKKIVIFTNLGNAEKVSDAVRQDMDGYVVKAEIKLPEILDIIKSLEAV